MINAFFNIISSLKFWNILLISSGFLSILFHLIGFRSLPLACYVIPMMTYYIFIPLVILSLLFRLMHYRYPQQKTIESLSMLITLDQAKPLSPYASLIGGIMASLYVFFWEYRYTFTPSAWMIEVAQTAENLVGSMYIRITIGIIGLLCITSSLYHLCLKTAKDAR